MATPESKVRDPVVAWAKQNGFLHFRMSFRPGVRQGTPDDLFIAPGGLHVWIEFKREGKEPTPLQYQRLDLLIDHSVAAFWCNDKVAGIAALQRVLNFSVLAMAQGGAVGGGLSAADRELLDGDQWTPEQMAQMRAARKLN